MVSGPEGNREDEFFKKLYNSDNDSEGCNCGKCNCGGEGGPKEPEKEWQDYNDGRKHYLDPFHKNIDWEFFSTLAPGLFFISHKLLNNQQPVYMGNVSPMGKERYAQWEEIQGLGLEGSIFSVYFIKDKFDEFVVALVSGKIKLKPKR